MHKFSLRHATPESVQLQPRRTALALNDITLCLTLRAPKARQDRLPHEIAHYENGKDDQNFLNRKIEVGARTGAVQVEWLQDD